MFNEKDLIEVDSGGSITSITINNSGPEVPYLDLKEKLLERTEFSKKRLYAEFCEGIEIELTNSACDGSNQYIVPRKYNCVESDIRKWTENKGLGFIGSCLPGYMTIFWSSK